MMWLFVEAADDQRVLMVNLHLSLDVGTTSESSRLNRHKLMLGALPPGGFKTN